MSDHTAIEWTDATWNPIRGCTRVSEGCRNCYAEVMAARFSKPGQWGHGLARTVTLADGTTDHRWTGTVDLVESALDLPLRWRRPRRIFVNSTSDLFHESVPDEWIDRVFAVMALAPNHTFQVLTKRPERARAYLTRFLPVIETGARVLTGASSFDRETAQGAPKPSYVTRDGKQARHRDPGSPLIRWPNWPLPNVWLGTSIEDQATADTRIPHLLATPAAVRFVSAEPLLGPVDLRHMRRYNPRGEPWINALRGLVTRGQYLARSPSECSFATSTQVIPPELPSLNWVIVGGESGPGARPMHPDWARSLRDQCSAAGVAYFFKQWGEWAPNETQGSDCAQRVGKRAAGRLLDGRTWDQMPGAAR